MKLTRKDFPEGFLFGAATSSYQIEGHGFGGAGRTHWDDYAATPGNVTRAENGARACDHYHRYPEDLDLVAAAGFDAYRFSISWARVMPDGRGAPNPEGLDFYDRLTDAMLKRGLKPYATLYHWELPSALADLGGWRNRDIAAWFGDFTETVMARIGDRMETVAPINEPWCVAWLSHFMGLQAPGLRDIRAATRAMHHVLLAHGRAIEVMRGLGMTGLGGVFNMEWSNPADDSDAARAAAARYDGIYNRWFMGGVFKGDYPAIVLDALEPHMPENWQDDMALISQPIDWCGINYYTRKNIAADPKAPWPSLREVPGVLPKTYMDWEIHPEGLHALLTRTAREYTGELPLYVTENGMAAHDDIVGGEVPDPHRIDYLEKHLSAVSRAIADGAPVQGYFCWSLLDNYEWSFGYDKRFGLVHVDFDTLARTPKASYHALRAALTEA
ncbi:beta-glucosidase [Salipiger aestuarii]|uniref:Beta-glucosidase n=1 Tax=Salipiger aestuarii TaxID=568098 RepID=A0A327YPZ0_9RHOB|nr:GH1 family beta-glucosidase [Salipiger aestuarii]KAA8607338.1 beta-glucosidase [Salipiger aestuarii]KAA8612969.1 beta-glucosidase [Salipiger aestuarii]KAB2543748.1 beta-glucosidase [Salipiger aestuarii]RAK23000.1 beta-glucosidase [Salipiger aestuarii]